ncbi:MAG TPA: hypothetical protein PK765_07000 [bacterium]|nr:hypothetical protein [bacterium]
MLGQADFANVRIAGDASATSSLVDPSSLMYTFIVGEYSSDLIQQGISSFSLEKILMLAVVLFSVQAIRGNFKDLFVDSAISKAVSLFLDGIKSVLRLIFGLYSYVVWQTTTRYVFSFSNWHLRRGIIPSVTSMGIFTIGYILLYAFIIGCYVGAANAIFGWYLDTPILAATILGMTMLAVGMNFYTDKRNLETFILEIDTLYGHLNENKTETA